MGIFSRRLASSCKKCKGGGTVNHPISPLKGATARRVCPHCRGRGTI